MIGVRSLDLAVRGLYWRRASSITIWLVAVVCVAVAAGGTGYAAAARDAVVQGALRRAPVDASGTGVTVSRPVKDDETTSSLAKKVAFAFSGSGAGAFRPAVMSIQTTGHVVDSANHLVAIGPVVYREGACAHLTLVQGNCLEESNRSGVLVSAASAAARGWHVGTQLTFSDFEVPRAPPLHVVGIYRPLAPTGRYWFGTQHRYFLQNTALAHVGVPQSDAVLVTASAWVHAKFDLHEPAMISADVALNPGRLHIGDIGGFESFVNRAIDRASPGTDPSGQFDNVDTALAGVVYDALNSSKAVAVPITVTAAQLLVLTWAVLFLIMVSSADSRASEVALGKLRGLKPRETLLHAVLEPTLLLLTALPIGVLVADVVLHSAARSVLGPYAAIGLGGWVWPAGVAAVVGGVLASLLASVSVLRRSVLEQWRRTERRPGRTAWIVDGVVAALAVFGFIELASGTPGTRGGDFLPVLAPGLLAVACALVLGRLLPLAGRAGFRATRGTRHVAWFVAVRQVARRPGDMRVFGLLTVAVALVVFGASSRAVFDRNRADRAYTELGASRVVVVTPNARVDATGIVARLDPAGTQAVAVHAEPVTAAIQSPVFDGSLSTTSPTLLIADPVRLARVAYWRPDFGPAARLSDKIGPLLAAAPIPPAFRGISVALNTRVTVTSGGPMSLRLGLTTAAGAHLEVALGAVAGPVAAGPRTLRLVAKVPGCDDGCTLRRISLVPGLNAGLPAFATVAIDDFDAVTSAGRMTSLLPAIRGASWTAVQSEPDGPADVKFDRSSVTLSVGSRFATTELGYAVYAGVPEQLPGLATASQVTGGDIQIGPSEGDPVQVRPVKVQLLPRAGDAGILVPRSWFVAAEPDGSYVYPVNQIWLGSRASADFPKRLAAAGLTVRSVQSAHGRAVTLGEQGPRFAVAMLAFGAIAAAALAVAGTATTLFVASRRRLYELAAMRSLGMRPRRLLASLVLEQALVSVAAAVVGVLAGAVGARVALGRIPEYADRPSFPPLLVELPLSVAIVVGAVVAAIVVVVAAIGGAVLVRRAAPARLREAQ